MRTYKVIVAAMAVMLTVAGCVDRSKLASTDEVDDLKNELAEEKAAHADLQDQYIQQNKEMSEILEELAAISGKTADLRLDVESGSAKLTQAEQISGSIDQIKARIAALEKSNKVMSGKNKEFNKMIEGFNNVIQEQELQISSLKDEIQAKDKTIKSQKDTINTQYQTILQQKDDLQRTVNQQAKMLCDAGEMLEEIADNAPEVSWKKNKEKMAVMTQDIYRKARTYYQKSLESGYAPAKDKLSQINAKIAAE